MSWFYRFGITEGNGNIAFKYILCLGSTKGGKKGQYAIDIFKYILCLGSTCVKYNYLAKITIFKYILCLGSTCQNGLEK